MGIRLLWVMSWTALPSGNERMVRVDGHDLAADVRIWGRTFKALMPRNALVEVSMVKIVVSNSLS